MLMLSTRWRKRPVRNRPATPSRSTQFAPSRHPVHCNCDAQVEKCMSVCLERLAPVKAADLSTSDVCAFFRLPPLMIESQGLAPLRSSCVRRMLELWGNVPFVLQTRSLFYILPFEAVLHFFAADKLKVVTCEDDMLVRLEEKHHSPVRCCQGLTLMHRTPVWCPVSCP